MEKENGTNTVLLVLVIIILIVGGFFWWRNYQSNDTGLNVDVSLPDGNGGNSQ